MAEKHFIELLNEEVPDIAKSFFGLADNLTSNAGLDPKTFQLVYIAIKAAACQTGSVGAHAAFAKQAGATREEVRGAVLVSLMTNGVDGVAACLAAALNGYDNA
jgi:alkylhydroperoxidase/carboxymuconolactone decarboxylase family protein YurZ